MPRPILAVLFCLMAVSAHAQDRPRFELEVGPGYALGGGAEDPSPSLGVAAAGGTVWLSRGWGVAVVYVRSYGTDLFEPQEDTGDRIFVGRDDLAFWRITARHRRTLSPSWSLDLGVGTAELGRFDTIMLVRFPEGPRRVESDTRFAGLSGEIYLRRALSRNLSLRLGTSLDTNLETTIFQPLALLVVGF